eukprot:UN09805
MSAPNSRTQIYVPRARSGGYALLVHMYDMYKNDSVQGFTKQQLIRDAQQFSDSSFSAVNNGYYTAWCAMSTLIRCDYIQQKNHGNNGSEYYLTATGKEIAKCLHAQLFGYPELHDLNVFSNKRV